jgi:hypothetical protein
MNGMPWGSVELEPEVEQWLDGLADEQFGQAAFSLTCSLTVACISMSRTRGNSPASCVSCGSTWAVTGSGLPTTSRLGAGLSC